jgi:hypothetical protein
MISILILDIATERRSIIIIILNKLVEASLLYRIRYLTILYLDNEMDPFDYGLDTND